MSLTSKARAGVAIAVSLTMACVAGVAQEAAIRKVMDIVRTETPPQVDGRLDEPVWQQATVIADLHQYDPLEHGVPSETSIFYVLYDDENLYVGARLLDSEPSLISARQMVQGQSVEVDDRIEVILDPFNNMRTGYRFQLNPRGVRRDGLFDRGTNVNEDWDGIWHAEAVIGDEGWTAEIVIPFKSLNFDPNNPDWGFTVGRAIPRKQEKMAWTSFDRDIHPSSAGVLSGFSGLQQGRGLDIIPSISLAGNQNYLTDSKATQTDPSLDVFYNFSPSLTGILTFNTDFSSTEVDDRQVNLTRFPTFFPEKRDFFLKDVDIFSFGPGRSGNGRNANGIPYFSRRIGLSDTGQAVDINSGAKLTGRIGRFNVGVLGVNQDGFEGRSGYVDESNLFVGRLSANVLEESSVGMIFTSGNPRSNIDNSLAGADFRYRSRRLLPGRTTEGSLWFQQADSANVEVDESNWGMDFGVNASEGLSGRVEYEVMQPNFDPALGFVRRSNYERGRVWGTYRYRPQGHRWIRTVQSILSIQQYNAYSTGEFETSNYWFRPFRIENHRGDNVSIALMTGREVLVEPFMVAGGTVIPAGEYEESGYQIEFEWAQDRVLAPSVEFSETGYYGGERFSAEGGVSWRPSSRW
ncbi:MAG: carbohydrate binding family 9 domain-containing protein, partial [Proteobacteria bacterium]|nr:carbohydrate binding family 9 domain-containing protein [Pseudomonadota bacterium]